MTVECRNSHQWFFKENNMKIYLQERDARIRYWFISRESITN